MMERSTIQRSIPAILIALLFAGTVFLGFMALEFGEPRVDQEGATAGEYIAGGNNDTGSANLVTSVVVNYRGFDTLGEVTILFLASTGVGALLSVMEMDTPRKQKNKAREPSFILQQGSRLILPLIILFGVYVFVHGHLSPGGGFQGGVIIASGLLLFYISNREAKARHRVLSWVESTSGLAFIGIGVIGLATASIFLDSHGVVNKDIGLLISAGLLPLIYIAIGLKVGSEMTGLVDRFRGDV
ncbi:MAG: Na(+)/H(+) antiporter subunit B [Candidatus Thermoplasmatota archaeon]|nr:Na(+)/H(+) antiporter subunit B [Candidatus Thermoplasmatota archaeon]